MNDDLLNTYLQILAGLGHGDFDPELPEGPTQLQPLNQAIAQLADTLRARDLEAKLHSQINAWINAGLVLEQVLDNVYHDLRAFIPYNRLGVSVIDPDGEHVRAIWARSDRPDSAIKPGYTAPLAGSSLATILETRQPRILNDLQAYLAGHPASESTRLILSEGIRSSLTCPLMVNGMPVGFLFFSSDQPQTYAGAHVETFQRIANQLSVLVEQNRMLLDLRSKNQELRRLAELKNTFLGMAAHDLRHPLSYIHLVSHLVLGELDHPTGIDLPAMIGNVQKQVDYMLSMLDSLLELVVIESSEIKLEQTEIELGVYLKDIVDQHAHLGALKGIEVYLAEVPAGLIRADYNRLHQVFDNLISNAIKYSNPGSCVGVFVERRPPGWHFRVVDQGLGIDAKDRQRIFNEFTRLKARSSSEDKSSGLGLSIAQRIVVAHGGEIGVESTTGEGSTFWFTIPANS